MEINTFVELINMIGFPIAACIALFWNSREQTKYYREMMREFQQSIDGNTKAINRLLERSNKD